MKLKKIILCSLMSLSIFEVNARMYKCADAEGNINYSDKVCKQNQADTAEAILKLNVEYSSLAEAEGRFQKEAAIVAERRVRNEYSELEKANRQPYIDQNLVEHNNHVNDNSDYYSRRSALESQWDKEMSLRPGDRGYSGNRIKSIRRALEDLDSRQANNMRYQNNMQAQQDSMQDQQDLMERKMKRQMEDQQDSMERKMQAQQASMQSKKSSMEREMREQKIQIDRMESQQRTQAILQNLR